MYDLRTEPWLEVRLLDGSRERMGVQALLDRAAEIDDLLDPQPLFPACLIRLLAGILRPALGVSDGPSWFRAWRAGTVSIELEPWDLHGAFLQHPEMEAHPDWVARLDLATPSGTNPIYEGRVCERDWSIEPDLAARLLVTRCLFPADSGKSYKAGFWRSPIVAVYPRGRNLAETLLLNLPASLSEGVDPQGPALTYRPEAKLSWGNVVYWPCRQIHLHWEGERCRTMDYYSGAVPDELSAQLIAEDPWLLRDETAKILPPNPSTLLRNVGQLLHHRTSLINQLVGRLPLLGRSRLELQLVYLVKDGKKPSRWHRSSLVYDPQRVAQIPPVLALFEDLAKQLTLVERGDKGRPAPWVTGRELLWRTAEDLVLRLLAEDYDWLAELKALVQRLKALHPALNWADRARFGRHLDQVLWKWEREHPCEQKV
jgi:hypothetical protein